MPTYDKSTGNSGTMRINDTGTVVEFWLKSGFPSTFFGSATFSYSSPNGSGSFSHGYNSGDTWQKMGQITVTSNGTVSWTMPNTGTSSLGGPTTQSVSVNRSTVPPAPTPLGVDEETHTSLRARFSGNGNGGSPIIRWELGYSVTGSVQTIITSNGTTTLNNLDPGVRYYFWARGVNANGNGPWSSRFQGDTLPPVKVRTGGSWKNAIPYVRVSGSWRPAVAYVRSGGSWKITDS